MEKDSNTWRQKPVEDNSEIREGKSSLDTLNQDNSQREQREWNNYVKQGNGDYGSEEGRSDPGATGGETEESQPFSGDDRIIPGGIKNTEADSGNSEEWNRDHNGETAI